VAHQIAVSEEVFTRLSNLARPFVDRSPEDVIRRLLDQNELSTDKVAAKPNGHILASVVSGVRSPTSRVPRERGAIVRIGDHKIDAVSVRTLYEEALKLFVANRTSQLRSVVPLKTSGERYLIATKPIHPTGKPFVIPVEYRGFCMEAHKDYKNAIAHLRILCERLGLTLQYLG
jgi:hypothetical protein